MCRSWELQSNLSVNPAFLNCLTNNITLHISTNQKGRKRNLSQHKQIRKALAFRIIELVFDAEGHGVDFVFRYCNDEMAVVEGIPVSEMLNRSFYEVFENGDKKWLVTYADYIEFSLKNPTAADNLLDVATEQIGSLANLAQKFRLVDDPILASWGIRFVIINNYLAFYTIDEEKQTVIIVRFLYQKSNWTSILRQGFSLI